MSQIACFIFSVLLALANAKPQQQPQPPQQFQQQQFPPGVVFITFPPQTAPRPAPAPAQPQIIYLPPSRPAPAPAPAPVPIFFFDQPHQAPAPAPSAPIFIRPPAQAPVPAPAPSPIFIHQQGQNPQQVASQSAPGQPIIIKLQPSPVTINQQQAPAQPAFPQIAAQALTPPPAAPTPPTPPKPTTTEATSLVDLIFTGEGDNVVTHCPVGKPVGWVRRQWKGGFIRPYYDNMGRRANLQECISLCESRDECYFATMTGSSTCYHLTTTHFNTCKFETQGHFGPNGEACTPARPCNSAYKQCQNPTCTLQNIINLYCKTRSKTRAVSVCSVGDDF